MDAYINKMDIQRPVEFYYPWTHNGDRLAIKVREDDTPNSLGMEDDCLLLIENDLHPCRQLNAGGWDMTLINVKRMQWMDRDEKLVWDDSFPIAASNH